MSDLASVGSSYTHRVISLAVRLVIEDGLPLRSASWHLWRDHLVYVPFGTVQNWVEEAGKKGEEVLEYEYQDWALKDFSGYLAADEIYDGPFCVLFMVDSKCQKRLAYEVLDHDPTKEDVRRFFKEVSLMLIPRNLSVYGITTDGSSLYPEVIEEVFPGVPHQVCEFHVLKEITKDVLKAIADCFQGSQTWPRTASN